jgi:hypothetical protein
LGNATYTHNQVNQWTSQVVESVLEQMAKLNKPYKYIGNYLVIISLFVYLQLIV